MKTESAENVIWWFICLSQNMNQDSVFLLNGFNFSIAIIVGYCQRLFSNVNDVFSNDYLAVWESGLRN